MLWLEAKKRFLKSIMMRKLMALLHQALALLEGFLRTTSLRWSVLAVRCPLKKMIMKKSANDGLES
jgi:hypothetical protein